jgi:glycosyltransferase involved in cell wall biosynthesis
MRSRRRLLFVVPSLAGGGAERVVSLLSTAFAPEYEVHVAVFDAEAAYEHGGSLHNLDVPAPAGGFRSALTFLWLATLRLRVLKRRLVPDACISFMSLANFSNILSGGPSLNIISVHTIVSRAVPASGSGRFARMLVRALYPRADKVIAVSKGARLDLIRNFSVPAKKVDVIYNPLSNQYLEAAISEPVPCGFEVVFRSPTVVAVGRLAWEKGHARLLRVFAALKVTHPSARLVIVGKGPLHDQLVTLAQSLRLHVWSAHAEGAGNRPDADVLFPGFVTQPMAFVRHASVFAFPSHHEGLGVALLEALATGVPTIASDCPSGPRELLAPGNTQTTPAGALEFAQYGLLAPNMSELWPAVDAPLTSAERHWADGLSRLMSDEKLRHEYGAAGRVRAKAFAIDIIMHQWKRELAGRDLRDPTRGGSPSLPPLEQLTDSQHREQDDQ